MCRPIMLLVVGLALVGGTTSIAANDLIEKKLTAAKEEFEKAGAKAQAVLLADLKRKEEAAKNAGDLKALERILAEAKAFESDGKLPKSVSTKGYESQIRMARSRLEAIYMAAIKQLTREGDLDGAKAVERELKQFIKDASEKRDTRRRWVHAKGEFVLIKEGLWEEKSPNGKRYRYKEVARTREYVEMEAINGNTALRFRLYEDRCDFGKKPNPNFTTMFREGKWMSSAEQK